MSSLEVEDQFPACLCWWGDWVEAVRQQSPIPKTRVPTTTVSELPEELVLLRVLQALLWELSVQHTCPALVLMGLVALLAPGAHTWHLVPIGIQALGRPSPTSSIDLQQLGLALLASFAIGSKLSTNWTQVWTSSL